MKEFDTNEQDIFYTYVDKYSKNIASFENNWSYILQATRGKGLKIEKYDSIIYFWIRDNKELVIVHRLGDHSIKIIEEIKSYCKEKNLIIVIKNVNENDVEDLGKISFKLKDYPWSEYSSMDDNTFPQIISDINGIVQLKSHALRDTHKWNIRKFLKKRNIEIKLYENYMESIARAILEDNSKYLEDKHVESRKEVYDAHLFFFENNLRDVYRFVFEENGQEIAFGFFTVRRGVVYWNALINRNESNLMLYLLWLGMKYITENSKEEVKKLTLQGCENEGQYRWKQGFYPIEEIKKVHMYLN